MKWGFVWLLFLHSFCFGQREEGFVPIDQFQIHYKVYGKKGRALLLINGGPGFSSNYLDDLSAQMAKDMKRTVVLFDPRGTGESKVEPIVKKTINLRNQVSDIDALRQHLEIHKWDVIGHAYGGAIAILYTHKYPENVNKLVLSSSIGPNLDFVKPMMANLKVRLSVGQTELLQQLAEQESKGQLSSTKYYKKRFDLLAEAYVFDKEQVEAARNMLQLETDYSLTVNQLLWSEMSTQNFNIEQKVREIKKPVLILHGHQDVLGESVPIQLNNLFPKSKLIFINEAGRYLWLDKPKLYFHYLDDFLN